MRASLWSLERALVQGEAYDPWDKLRCWTGAVLEFSTDLEAKHFRVQQIAVHEQSVLFAVKAPTTDVVWYPMVARASRRGR